MARVAKAMATATKRAIEMAVRAMAMMTKRARARAARGTGTATKRAIARAARAMATATRMADDKEGDSKIDKSDGNGKEEGNGDGN
jgi:hypothetical protein